MVCPRVCQENPMAKTMGISTNKTARVKHVVQTFFRSSEG
jgi:hypothetical protein